MATSVAPERIAGPNAPVERRLVAASVLGQLSDAFFVSLAALIPLPTVGYIVLVLAVLYFAALVPYAVVAAWEAPGVARKLRRGTLVLQGVGLYGWQVVIALGLVRGSGDVAEAYNLSVLLIAMFGLSIIRAWELLGARRFGLLAQLSPLTDLDRDEP